MLVCLKSIQGEQGAIVLVDAGADNRCVHLKKVDLYLDHGSKECRPACGLP